MIHACGNDQNFSDNISVGMRVQKTIVSFICLCLNSSWFSRSNNYVNLQLSLVSNKNRVQEHQTLHKTQHKLALLTVSHNSEMVYVSAIVRISIDISVKTCVQEAIASLICVCFVINLPFNAGFSVK